jgi:AraC-like DNA-binding protein
LKYENAELSESQLKIFHHQLTQLMLTDKCYQTPEITLSDIAQKLQIHPNTLSQVINRVEQKNFFDFINGLRVEEFKKRIANAEHLQYTMLSVAYNCGFNSKTSFNRNFKNHTGIAPSVYISSLSNPSK